MTLELRADTPKTKLTLSAVPELLPEDAESASYIEAELARIRTARRTGAHRTAEAHLERLIDYVWFGGESA